MLFPLMARLRGAPLTALLLVTALPAAGPPPLGRRPGSSSTLTPRTILRDIPRDLSRDTSTLATITTDTGPLAPGNRDFSRFTVPVQCVSAAEIARDVGRRALAWQLSLTTIREIAPEHDTVPTTVAAVARACRTQARLTVARTAPQDLPDLFTLALLEGNDSLAHAVVQRRLALAGNPAAQDTVWTQVVQGYLANTPAWVTAADSAVAAADQLGFTETNHADPLPAHAALLAFARESFDRARMRREADWIIALGRKIPFRTLQNHEQPLDDAYAAWALLAFVDTPDSLPLIARQAKQDMGRFPSSDFSYQTASLDQVLNHLLPFGAAREYPDSVQRFLVHVPVSATYWYPTKPAVWPAHPGQAALVIYGQMGSGGLVDGCERDNSGLLNSRGRECAPLFSYLPQWAVQYGSRLAITLVAHTGGAAMRSVVLPPAAGAGSVDWYFRAWLKLPVTVAVVEDSVGQVPEPDGRRFYHDTTAYGRHRLMFSDGRVPEAWFFDATGRLQWLGKFDPTILRVLLARALPAATSDTK